VSTETALVVALISKFSRQPEPPTRDEILVRAQAVAAALDFDGDLTHVVTEVMSSIDTHMGAGISLVNQQQIHDEAWVSRREDITWTYSGAYATYLLSQRWQQTLVQTLDDVSTRLLSHLQNPRDAGAWGRRGLVIGSVQSGKTANYLGLVAKAADAGYKFIIVIAGIHNNLRRQTQQRVEEGFIGRSSAEGNGNQAVGVGELVNPYPHPATLTTITKDFNVSTAQNRWELNDFSKPIIIVIKKNVSTLRTLNKWLSDLNTKRGGDRIAGVPMLLIDDEADNASINTNREDINPTQTNFLIRELLGLFEQSCYVGYTATPFANIFINPDAYDAKVREELFPRDFIYSLDPPTTYFGPDKVFLDEAFSAGCVRTIDDCEAALPQSHKLDHDLGSLPASLERALCTFVVARAIRNLRGQAAKHCSMMINISRFVAVQKQVKSHVSIWLGNMKPAVRANYRMPEPGSSANPYMAALKQAFEAEYSGCGHTWLAVKEALLAAVDAIKVFVVNSKTDEVLDYRRYEADGDSLTAIAIGGLSLSRGLTIEGLTVSYMYRNTMMYDTLMQMGRWFGYRPGYEDLCRVHLSRDSIDWYGHIAEATEELRAQIRQMRRDGMSPRDFGLYVESHPDRLMITAANKMRDAEEVVISRNFTGKLRESTHLPLAPAVNARNEALLTRCFNEGFGGKAAEATGKGWIFRDVSCSRILSFLHEFEAHPAYEEMDSVLQYLSLVAEKYPAGDVLVVSMGDAQSLPLGAQRRVFNNVKPDAGFWLLNGYRVASRGDEKLGLTPAQMAEVRAKAEEQGGKGAEVSDHHYRAVRNKPLLMLHVISPGPRKGEVLPDDVSDTDRFPAFGVSFPDGLYKLSVDKRVAVNKVWREQNGMVADSPDEEDDYDV
jgi:hypothetical protein